MIVMVTKAAQKAKEAKPYRTQHAAAHKPNAKVQSSEAAASKSKTEERLRYNKHQVQQHTRPLLPGYATHPLLHPSYRPLSTPLTAHSLMGFPTQTSDDMPGAALATGPLPPVSFAGNHSSPPGPMDCTPVAAEDPSLHRQ